MRCSESDDVEHVMLFKDSLLMKIQAAGGSVGGMH